MAYLVVPHAAGTTWVTIWVAAVMEPRQSATLELGSSRGFELDENAWTVWHTDAGPQVWSQRITVEDLSAGTRYPVRVVVDGAERTTGTAVTLPDELPSLGARPFICLLGSCFAYFGDGAGAAGAAYRQIPVGARPDVKFMCGDQVYLDAPFPRYLFNVFGEDALRAELLASYVSTWTQGGDGKGFYELLRSGATYFGSDDHEVWNNAPLPTPLVRTTWWPFGDFGAAWSRLATGLYDQIQTEDRLASFEIGRLSFRVLDTRLDRSRDRKLFCRPEDLSAVGRWVEGLRGPGVLVVGQPIFAEPTGIKGFITDFGLVDHSQYGDLARILSRSQHDLLVVTGDVHFGRVAGCQLASGASLVEVIASPFALVDPAVGGHWRKPPSVFPPYSIPDTTPRAVWFNDTHKLAKNQFATLEFSADGSRVLASVRAWEIPEPGHAPASVLVHQQRLS